MASEGAEWLSAANASATATQRAIEAEALAIFASEPMQKAREQASFMWRSAVGDKPDERAWQRFDAAMEEYTFNAALKGANSDASHPAVLGHIYSAPHHWLGMDVPGSRLAGDNPDNHYSLIPVDGSARFVLEGQWLGERPGDVNFTVMGNTTLSRTMASLEGRDLVVDGEGRFTVTVGPQAPTGPNHLRTRAGAQFIFIRESRSSWTQGPARLTVTRLDPPAAAPMSFDEKVQRAVDIAFDDVPWSYWWMHLCHALEPNTMRPPFRTVAVGGLYSQQVSFGRLFLREDEAFVITVDAGGAGFRNLVLHDFWYRSMTVDQRQSCLNSGQAAADDDGRFTYVVAHEDPGVHNWLDPEGQNSLLLVHRWQILPRESASGGPAIVGRVVPRADLDAHLPSGIRRIDAGGRTRQLATRAQQFAQRFVDQ